jgi:DNA-binding MarR family transcriptional regulator
MTLKERVRQVAFRTLEEEAMVALLVAAAQLRRRLDEVCALEDITADQYNVLRILRGVYPDGHPRYEISERLIDRAPDVTRLLDRLSKGGLVRRYRADGDRRLSLARITDRGLALLDRLDGAIAAEHDAYSGPLTTAQKTTLARLCSTLIAGSDAAP